MRGANQVYAAIVASTLTTMVVFLPLVFVRGQTGLLFRQLGYVVSFSLACSLAVALSLVPMLAARMLAKGEGAGGALARFVGRGLGALEEAYRALLEEGGFTVRSLVLFPRPTPLPGDVSGWLETFAEPFLGALPAGERAAAVDEIREILRPQLFDAEHGWTADYVRLRFAAERRED